MSDRFLRAMGISSTGESRSRRDEYRDDILYPGMPGFGLAMQDAGGNNGHG